MLDLIREAREVDGAAERVSHLVAGIQRVVGAAMTTWGVFRNAEDPRRRRVDFEVSTPSADEVRTMIAALQNRSYASCSLPRMVQLLRSKPAVTARRRELLSDADWYASESFTDCHRPCGFDDFIYSFRVHDGNRISGMAIRRAVGDRPFGEEERDLLDLFHDDLSQLMPAPGQDDGGPRLAPRERDVLERLLRGNSEKEVAFELKLSPHTVHSYAKSIYSAFRVSSRAELLARCLAGEGP